jgi:penicillin-binding protein 1C
MQHHVHGFVQWWRGLRRRSKIASIAGVGLMLALIGGYFWLFAGLPSIDNIQAGLALPSTRIYDRQGRLLYEVIDPNGGRNTAIPLSVMPQTLIQATVATEDRNFYTNPGVDLEGIIRAFWINLRGGEVRAGGSTITQQVARNLLLDPNQRAERTLTRKLREIILALQLNARYSREQILAFYLNQTYYGNLAYGVQAAAQVYFGKDASALDLAESALLAGLPQAPGQYDPLTDPATAQGRQKTVLRLMQEAGYISQDQADSAARQPLQFARGRFPIEAPHFVLAVWDQVSKQFPDQAYHGGLEIRTTLDLDWQHAAERIAAQQIDALNRPGPGQTPHNATNAALVAMDPHTGQIRAMLGSVDYFNAQIGGAINMALAPRQPGSTLKPFTYALNMDPRRPDAWAPATMLLDVSTPFVTRRLESFTPANYGLAEHGPTTVREALASSFNIPAVVALNRVGVSALLSLLHDLGVTTLTDPARYDLALTLGGGEIRLAELVAAYSAFPNQGIPVAPQYVLEVKDKAGMVLYQAAPPAPREPVIDPRVAFLINDILSDNGARLASFGSHSALEIARPAAAKTGTTTDFRDNWTVGYTPSLIVGVWVGNTDNSPMVNVSGVAGAGPIWNDFMRLVLKDTPEDGFMPPPGVHQVEVCALSGMLPSPLCPRTRFDWFIDGAEPRYADTLYQKFTLDRRSGLLANAATPPDQRFEQVYAVLPQEAQAWALKNGFPQPPRGARLAPAGDASADQGVRILSPDPYTIFQLAPQTPFDTQQIRFTAAAPAGTQRVTYYLDDRVIGTAEEAPYGVWWGLRYGAHTAYAIAEMADGARQRSPAVRFDVQSYVPIEAQPVSGNVGVPIPPTPAP